MNKKNYCLLFCAIFFLAGCAAHTNLEPVGKENTNFNISVGGPIVKAFGMNLPIPYSTAGVVYGLTEKINIDANLHLTAIPYKLFGLDFGAAYFPRLNEGFIPTIGLHPRLLYLISMKPDVESRMRLYPSLSSVFSWKIGSNLIFTGFDFTVPISRPDYDNEAAKLIFSPFVGYRIELGKKIRLISEIKWQAANVSTDQLAAEYTKLSGKGAFAILFSLERSF